MAFRRQTAMGTRETRTQRGPIAALLTRLRTRYGAAQCVLVAYTPFFSSLLGSPVVHRRRCPAGVVAGLPDRARLSACHHDVDGLRIVVVRDELVVRELL